MRLAEVAEAILHSCPEWKIESIQYLDEGDSCTAYVVNGEWIFRVAKHNAAREGLRREYCLLPRLAGQFLLKIPSPQIADLDQKTELPFTGYPLLPGTSLSQEQYHSLSEIDRTRCAEQVGLFLSQLHSVDLEPARACGVPLAEYAKQYSGLLSRARAELYPALHQSERLFVERIISSYLESGDALAFRPSLLH